MKARILITVACVLLLCATSCSIFTSSNINIEAAISDKSEDGSRTLEVSTSLGSTSLHFGSARLTPWSVTSINEQGDSLNTLLWTPAGRNFDTTRVAIVVHGFDTPLLGMYPLAINLVQKGLPVLFISLRGTNRNAHMVPTLGLADIADISDVLSAYTNWAEIDTVRAAIFGTSLGSVVALNAGTTDTRIVAIVCEGIWYNTEKIAATALTDDARALYEQNKNAYVSKQPSAVLSTRMEKPLFLLWGSNDHLTTAEDMNAIVALARTHTPAFQYRIVEHGSHSMRYGFPLSQDEALAVNDSIASFMLRALHTP